MSIAAFYSLSEIRRETGENPNLLTYLLHDRGIPHKLVGTAKCVDEDGRRLLLEAVAEYHTKVAAPAAS